MSKDNTLGLQTKKILISFPKVMYMYMYWWNYSFQKSRSHTYIMYATLPDLARKPASAANRIEDRDSCLGYTCCKLLGSKGQKSKSRGQVGEMNSSGLWTTKNKVIIKPHHAQTVHAALQQRRPWRDILFNVFTHFLYEYNLNMFRIHGHETIFTQEIVVLVIFITIGEL